MGIKEEGGGSAGRAQTLNVVKQRDMTNRGNPSFPPPFLRVFQTRDEKSLPARACECASTNETGEDFCQSSSRSIRSNIKRRWWEE